MGFMDGHHVPTDDSRPWNDAPGAGLKLTLRIEVAPAEGLSPQKVDETRVALRELGLKDSLDSE